MKTQWHKVRLASWSWEVPGEVLSSAQIEGQLAALFTAAGIEPGLLAAKTGVQQRRLYAADTDPEQVAARVAAQALSRAGLRGQDVGAVFSASIDHRYFEPSAAHFVARALGGAPSASLIDVRNACLGFVDALTLAADRIESGAIEVAVVVAAEAGGMRRAIDTAIADALASGVMASNLWVPLTMGCGAVAFVLTSHTLFPYAPALRFMVSQNQSEHLMLCAGRIENDGRLAVNANGPAILRHGVPLVVSTWRLAEEAWAAKLQQVFMHQVGSALCAAIENALGFTFEAHSLVFPLMGNQGPVGAPLALARAADAGLLRSGESVTILGAGSGLCSTVLGLEWNQGHA